MLALELIFRTAEIVADLAECAFVFLVALEMGLEKEGEVLEGHPLPFLVKGTTYSEDENLSYHSHWRSLLFIQLSTYFLSAATGQRNGHRRNTHRHPG